MSQLNLSKFKPRCPKGSVHGPSDFGVKVPHVLLPAVHSGIPVDIVMEEEGPFYTSYRFQPLSHAVGALHQFESLYKADKRMAVWVSTQNTKGGGVRAKVAVGVCEYGLSNQCLTLFEITNGGLPGKYHSVEQLFQAMKIKVVAKTVGQEGAQWVQDGVKIVMEADKPRACQVATGGNGKAFPPGIFGVPGVKESWERVSQGAMVVAVLSAACGSAEYWQRLFTLYWSVVDEFGITEMLEWKFAEMREQNPKDVWGSGVLLTTEWENHLFAAALRCDDGLFSPGDFIQECGGGEALNFYGKSMSHVMDFVKLKRDATHEDFCKRALPFIAELCV